MSASVAIPLALAVRTLASAWTIGLPGPCLRLWERYIIVKKSQEQLAPSLKLHLGSSNVNHEIRDAAETGRGQSFNRYFPPKTF